MTIFALSHGTHSDAKILFTYGEKDGETKMLTSEFITEGFEVVSSYVTGSHGGISISSDFR
jgi:hypothetical protein